jgi:mono/diheme cytochrome c family protein
MPLSKNALLRGIGMILLLAIMSTSAVSCMRSQVSIRAQQPPRLEAPMDSVPISATPEPLPTEAQALSNPIPADQNSVSAGQTLFVTYCVMCHGQDAKGTGPVGQSFQPPPADLTSPSMDSLSDGQIFTFISNGFGRMPPFRYDLNQDQRWNVVNYVRSLRKG